MRNWAISFRPLFARFSRRATKLHASRRAGASPAADWFAIEEAFNKEVDLLGLPRKDAEPGWRTAAEWLREHLDDAEPSKTAVNEHARKMLQRRMERDGN